MKRKFTLIELIIVVIVIGILAAISLPNFINVVRDARTNAMINDAEVLEKTLILYYQKYDKIPLLSNDQELIVLNNDISLVKLVQAEEAQNNDMTTIYTSLQETLKHYNDDEENLYRIDINKINNNLSKKLKYGHKKEDKDFYVYSTKTNNVYYYNIMLNGEGEIYHNEFNTKLKISELVDKKNSYDLNNNKINNKPIIELITCLENLNKNSIINWEYKFIDEDKEPTKISFILNETEYDNLNNIPTQLDDGKYTIKLKMQDSKDSWSNEIITEFKVETKIEENFKDIVYVKATGKDTIENGTKEKPYKTIYYALTQVKDNGSIYIDGRINLTMIVDFDIYKKNVNFIGDYKNKKSEFYNAYRTEGRFYTRDYKVTFNGIKLTNDDSYSWGEGFVYCNNITFNNCVFYCASGYSNVFGNYTYNNCVIEKIGKIYSPTTFNNCVFLNREAIGNNSLGYVAVDSDYNIVSSDNWINAGIDEHGNKTNIGVYGGKYPWKY